MGKFMSIQEKMLITVKTYPTLSKRYKETVCTAGITEDGDWRRLYPIRFRYLDEEKKYKLYDHIEITVDETSSDGRPESRRPQTETIRVIQQVKSWSNRVEWVKPSIMQSMDELISAQRTIGAVKVEKVEEFYWKSVAPDWSESQKELLRQDGLWSIHEPQKLQKIPYEFRIKWIDSDGASYDNMFISWEVCQTWRTYQRTYEKPLETMRDAWMSRFQKAGMLAFYMGNSRSHPQNFMICETFHPPKKEVKVIDTLW